MPVKQKPITCASLWCAHFPSENKKTPHKYNPPGFCFNTYKIIHEKRKIFKGSAPHWKIFYGIADGVLIPQIQQVRLMLRFILADERRTWKKQVCLTNRGHTVQKHFCVRCWISEVTKTFSFFIKDISFTVACFGCKVNIHYCFIHSN